MPNALNWFDEVRDKLGVVIFGPYGPRFETARLTALRDSLRSLGYVKASLVKDIDTPERVGEATEEEYFLHKSRHWVENCDVGLMVYMARTNNNSVTTELNHLATDAFAVDRIWRFTVFFDQKASIRTLTRGLTSTWSDELHTAYYSSQKQLDGLAAGRCAQYLPKLYYILRARPR